MASKVLLNWIPFADSRSGASRRAVELHRRLTGELSLTAAVTGVFPLEDAQGVPLRVAAPVRNTLIRLREGTERFWTGIGGEFDLWVTDSLPIPRFPDQVKTLITVHDLRYLENWRHVSLKRYLLLRLGMRAGLRRADAVVTVSRWTASQLEAHYGVPPERINVIPNAAPVFAEGEAGNTRDCILSVGHLESRKDHATLIRAFAEIGKVWDGSLVVVGNGPLRRKLVKLATDLGVGDRVRLSSAVGEDELASLYRECRCLVCPSLSEGFGMTLLEGLAAGIPVVASRIPPHEEVAGDTAVYFTPGDPESLARALRPLLAYPVSKGESDPARGRARALIFQWDHSAKQLSHLYQSL